MPSFNRGSRNLRAETGAYWEGQRAADADGRIEATIADPKSELHPIWNMRHTIEILFV
jgi:hypothetical protein